MRMILLENVRNLGSLGEIVEVRPGYGRNFLLPQKKAVFATPQNVAEVEARREELEKKAASTLAQAQERAKTINEITLEISAQASDEGKLYGSVGVQEIKDHLAAQSIEVSKREIVMPEGPIHSVGEYQVEIHVHSNVIANLLVKVVPAK